MCMALGASEAWIFLFPFFFFFMPFSHPLPPASHSCPSPPSPLSYWEVFHEQLGPGRGEVSERGALCIIQWLSGVCTCVCVCVYMYLCLCVCVPPPPIGRCQVTGRPCQCLSAGFLLEQSHCSQHYHKLMSAAQARLNTRPLIPSSDVTRQTQTLSTPKHHLFFCSVTHFCSAQTSFVQHGKKNSHTTEHFWKRRLHVWVSDEKHL